MSKLVKMLFGVALLLFVVSYPVGHFCDQRVHAEMAKYPTEFVETHYFDWVFLKYALPAVLLFFSGSALVFVGVVVWIVERVVAATNRRYENTDHRA